MNQFPYLIYNDKSSLDFGLYIVTKGSYNAPARDVNYTSIPGRNGDLITDNGRYSNIIIPYTCSILNNTFYPFDTMAHNLKSWLCLKSGYFRLWDSYDPDYFRLASHTGELNIEQELKDVGRLSLAFNCKPYKYSYSGLSVVTFTSPGKLYNAEYLESLPYMKIIGNGNITLYINNSAYTFTGIDGYIEIDSEIMNAYKGIIPQNNKMTSVDFPALVPGYNIISWTGNVQKIEIIPRWCCL